MTLPARLEVRTDDQAPTSEAPPGETTGRGTGENARLN